MLAQAAGQGTWILPNLSSPAGQTGLLHVLIEENSASVTLTKSIGQSKSCVQDQLQEIEKQILLFDGNSCRVTLQWVCIWGWE